MMATTLPTHSRSQQTLTAAQICQQLAAMKEQDPSVITNPDHRSGSTYSDKENSSDKHIHQEILDKLKHDRSSAVSPTIHQAQLHAEQWLNYQKLRAAALSGGSESPLTSGQQAADLLRRDFLLSLQSRSKLEYFQQLAAFQEQQQQQQQHQQQQQQQQQQALLSSGSDRPQSSPSRRSSQSPDECDDVDMEMMSPNPGPNNGSQWTYEEQFKQLYELGDEPERKAFLDELFAFMQKRGTPVNRIPIMAKQTLDMYKLFKLVVSKGGLVEVINKKLWREITKGLNLPSSITSAAFTLRTQYMKYIYPYECEKYGFSSPTELQVAIDGNRREGRRPGYGYDLPSQSLPPFYGQQNFPAANPFFNPLMSNPMASLLSSTLTAGSYMNSPAAAAAINGTPLPHPRLSAPSAIHSLPPSRAASVTERGHSPIDISSRVTPPTSRIHKMSSRSTTPDSGAEYNTTKFSPPRLTTHNSPTATSRNDSMAIQEQLLQQQQALLQLQRQRPLPEPVPSSASAIAPEATCSNVSSPRLNNTTDRKRQHGGEPSQQQQSPPIKRSSAPTVSTSCIRITSNSRSCSESSDDNSRSISVSFEVDGCLYQGVLFAQGKKSNEN